MSRRTLLEAPSRGLALLLDLALEPRRQVVKVALGEDGVASCFYGLDYHMIVALVSIGQQDRVPASMASRVSYRHAIS